jgi:selenocysteine lyase/cysteine desulfurase
MNRRNVLKVLGAGTLIRAGSVRAEFGADSTTDPLRGGGLPDKTRFAFSGTHLNAAFAHPFGTHCREAAAEYLQARTSEVNKLWPVDNPRDAAVRGFAELIHAAPTDVAVVPSTLVGENLIAEAMCLGPSRGVVTDSLHYDASLAMYGERHRAGMPLIVLEQRDNKIDYEELRRAITPDVKLVAVSWVSSWTGFTHDLKTVCEIAHEKNAMVYADIIQGVGAVPLDVRQTGVDFCCAGTYKWLMGDFGVAFLYAKPQSLAQLRRPELGWRGLTSYTSHFLPGDPSGPSGGEWTLGSAAGQIFEVGTPDWCALEVAAASIAYLEAVGVSNIARYRAPLLDLLQTELSRAGFLPLTPRQSEGPFVVFAREGVRERYARRLEEARIYVTLAKNRIRISASVYNNQKEMERLVQLLNY